VTSDATASRPKLVLASGSPRRLQLLQQVGIEPDALMPADIDETPLKNELPRSLAARLSAEKAKNALKIVDTRPDLSGSYLLSADTVVAVGRRILPKPEISEEAADCLRLLSGRQHRVYTGVTMISPRTGERRRLVETRVRFKRLSSQEIDSYLASGEWRGKAGGYALQGYGEVYVRHIAGSYSNVVGLPLAETRVLLKSAGYDLA
jgi:septum formation protein